jgi:hypothetical protein
VGDRAPDGTEIENEEFSETVAEAVRDKSFIPTQVLSNLGETISAASFVLKNVGMQLVTYRESSREKLPLELQIGISKRPKNAPFLFHIAYENVQKWNVKYTDPNATIIVDPLTGLPVEERTWEFGDLLMRHLVIGTEIILGSNVRIGLGYNYRQRKELSIPNRPATAGLSFGTTVNLKKFQLSYARSIYHVAGGSNHITFTTSI